tara:strand:+ start:375 stop:1037 length:663 start_codon:yes stop_codon:yes gene_type:complete
MAIDKNRLLNFADSLQAMNAGQSGNIQGQALYMNRIKQRKLDEEKKVKEEEARLKAEKIERDKAAFIAANPEYAQMINMNQLFGITPPAAPKVVTPNSYKEYERTTQNPTQEGYAKFLDRNKTRPKKTKSDFVVEILGKIQTDPNYKLTKADQRILDTVSSTDPLEIYKRQIINNQVSKTKTQIPSISTGPVTVTTQKEFDDLPVGTTYIYSGTEYVKGK